MDISITYNSSDNSFIQAKSLLCEMKESFPDEAINYKINESDDEELKIIVDSEVLFDKKIAKRWPVYREVPDRITEILTKNKKVLPA